jgi:RimJ/RimL family protein N-acetyltransferase
MGSTFVAIIELFKREKGWYYVSVPTELSKPLEYLADRGLIQKAYWHKGYALEAAQACKNYAFERLNADEVFSIIRDTNTASQNVAKRNGMTVKGTLVKHYRSIDMPHYAYSVKRTV